MKLHTNLLLIATAALAGLCFSGCSTLDKAYTQQVRWTNSPTVEVVTNVVVMTNVIPQVVERTNIVLVTNVTTGAVSGYASREPVATNFVTVVATNWLPIFYTN